MQIFSQNLVDIYKVLSVDGKRIKAHNFTLIFDKRMDGVGGWVGMEGWHMFLFQKQTSSSPVLQAEMAKWNLR